MYRPVRIVQPLARDLHSDAAYRSTTYLTKYLVLPHSLDPTIVSAARDAACLEVTILNASTAMPDAGGSILRTLWLCMKSLVSLSSVYWATPDCAGEISW